MQQTEDSLNAGMSDTDSDSDTDSEGIALIQAAIPSPSYRCSA
jgi:hypothetical protein